MAHSGAFLRIVLKNEHQAYNFHKIAHFLLQSAGPETLHMFYQGDSTCSGFLRKRATNWDHLDPIRNIRNVKKTPGRVISEEMAVLMGLLLGYRGDTTFSGFLVARVTNWDLMDQIRNIRNVRKTPGWVILEETAAGHQQEIEYHAQGACHFLVPYNVDFLNVIRAMKQL